MKQEPFPCTHVPTKSFLQFLMAGIVACRFSVAKGTRTSIMETAYEVSIGLSTSALFEIRTVSLLPP